MGDNHWKCPQCRYDNNKQNKHCERCNCPNYNKHDDCKCIRVDKLENKLNDIIFQLQKQLPFQYQNVDQKQDQEQKQDQMDTNITTLKNIGNPQIHIHNDMSLLIIFLLFFFNRERADLASSVNLKSLAALVKVLNE